jgi:hypothetical protein
MSSVRLIIVPTSSRRAVPSVAQVSSLNVGRSRRVPRNRKGQSRRALCLLRGTDGSNPSPSTGESANLQYGSVMTPSLLGLGGRSGRPTLGADPAGGEDLFTTGVPSLWT